MDVRPTGGPLGLHCCIPNMIQNVPWKVQRTKRWKLSSSIRPWMFWMIQRTTQHDMVANRSMDVYYHMRTWLPYFNSKPAVLYTYRTVVPLRLQCLFISARNVLPSPEVWDCGFSTTKLLFKTQLTCVGGGGSRVIMQFWPIPWKRRNIHTVLQRNWRSSVMCQVFQIQSLKKLSMVL